MSFRFCIILLVVVFVVSAPVQAGWLRKMVEQGGPSDRPACFWPIIAMSKEEIDAEDLVIWKRILRILNSTRGRTLLQYTSDLGPGFETRLTHLGDGTWLDLGTGEIGKGLSFMRGESDIKPGKKSRFIGVELIAYDELDRKMIDGVAEKLGKDRLVYLDGKPYLEIKNEDIGKVRLATDHMGTIAYSKNPQAEIRKTLELLEEDGAFIFTLARDNDRNHLTLVDGNYKEVPYEKYFSAIEGIDHGKTVIEKVHSGWRVTLVRGKGPIKFGYNLKRKAVKANQPPVQVFEMVPEE